MTTFTVYNLEGKKVGTVAKAPFFELPVDDTLIHRYVTWVRNSMRPTIAHTKTRGEVSGGGKKPWRQKGTGRARVGSSRTPLWRHGGIVFGPLKEQNWATRMPRTERRKAFLSALAAKAQADQIVVLKEWSMTAPKTKEVVSLLEKLPLKGQKVLHIHPQYESSLFLASRNLPTISAKTLPDTNILDILGHDSILLTEAGLNALEQHFTGTV